MGKVTNIEYGNIDYENVNIESGNIEFNFENGNIDSMSRFSALKLQFFYKFAPRRFVNLASIKCWKQTWTLSTSLYQMIY